MAYSNTAKVALVSVAILAPFSTGIASGVMSMDPLQQKMTLSEVEAVMSNRLRGPAKKQAEELAKHLVELCDEYRFDPAFVLSLIHKESSFNPKARSHVGALGLMQILPSTAQYIADRIDYEGYRKASDLRNPFINLSLGVAYLSYLRGRFPASQQFLAAYNMGPTAVGRMVHRRAFKLGALEGYVTGIQSGHRIMKETGIRLVSASR